MVLTLNTCITKHSKKEKECLEVFDPTFPFADSGWPFPGWGPPRLTTQNRWGAAEETTPASSDLSTPLIYQNQSVQLVPSYVQLVPNMFNWSFSNILTKWGGSPFCWLLQTVEKLLREPVWVAAGLSTNTQRQWQIQIQICKQVNSSAHCRLWRDQLTDATGDPASLALATPPQICQYSYL